MSLGLSSIGLTVRKARAVVSPRAWFRELAGAPVTREIAWNTSGNIVNQAGFFAVNLALARTLGVTEYGRFGLIQGTVLAASALAEAATGSTALKYTAELRKSAPRRAGHILSLCGLVSSMTALILGLALMSGAGSLARDLLKSPGMLLPVRVAALQLFFLSINGFQIGALIGLGRYREFAINSAVASCLHVVCVWLLARQAGVAGAVCAQAVGAILRWGLFQRAVRCALAQHGIVRSLRGAGAERSVVFRYALPSALNAYINLPCMWLASVLLSRQPGGLAAMGIYSMGMIFKNGLLFLPGVLGTVGIVRLNTAFGSGDHERFARVFRKLLYSVVGVTAGTGTVLLACLSLLRAAIGESYGGIELTILILTGAALCEAVANTAYKVLQVRAAMWRSLREINIPRDLTFLSLAALLSPRFGANGLAAANLCAAALYAGMAIRSGRVMRILPATICMRMPGAA